MESGYRIRVQKISMNDAKQKANLRGIGVESVPCLIMPGSRPVEGVKNIVRVLRALTRDGGGGDDEYGYAPGRQNHGGNNNMSYSEGDDIELYLAAAAMEGMGEEGGQESVNDDENWDAEAAKLNYIRNNKRHGGAPEDDDDTFNNTRGNNRNAHREANPRDNYNNNAGHQNNRLEGIDEDDAETAFLLDSLALN